MAKEKKVYELENYTILGGGIWISQKELERLYKAYETYKSDVATLSLSDLIHKIKNANNEDK